MNTGLKAVFCNDTELINYFGNDGLFYVITFDDVAVLVDGTPVNETKRGDIAKFIVRACNNHDELVAALKDVFALLEEHEPIWYLRRHYSRISKALAKAEEV